MNERYLQKTSVKILNTFRIFCCIAQSLWKKEEKTRILQNIVGARENMMGGTHFSSNDLKLARKKARCYEKFLGCLGCKVGIKNIIQRRTYGER